MNWHAVYEKLSAEADRCFEEADKACDMKRVEMAQMYLTQGGIFRVLAAALSEGLKP
jgi:hypothetical protein